MNNSAMLLVLTSAKARVEQLTVKGREEGTVQIGIRSFRGKQVVAGDLTVTQSIGGCVVGAVTERNETGIAMGRIGQEASLQRTT